MKKATKCLLGGALLILLLTPVSQVKADWHQDNVGWWYSLNNGAYYKNTEANIDGKSYKFDDRGYMITGWQYNVYNGGDYSGWYYYDPVTGEEKRGWQLIDGKWYYLTPFGARSGHENINGKLYYFDPVNCDMKTGWISNPGYSGTEWNYYDPVSGEKATGWRNIDGKWYYFIFGALKGSQNLDGEKYYFDPVNCDMQTGWVSIQEASGTKRYYYDPESGKQLSGWQEIDGKKYYFGLYGAYSGHISGLDGKDYYFDSDTCELKIGWFESGKYKYYADPNDGGALARSKTLIIDGISYTFDNGGTLINNIP